MFDLLIYWFRSRAAKAAKEVLADHFDEGEIRKVLEGYWHRYLQLKSEVPNMPTLGGSLTVHLSAMSIGFHQEMTAQGFSEEESAKLFYDIAWVVYQKMGEMAWAISGIGSRAGHKRLSIATKLFRKFPFNSPSYKWKDVRCAEHVIGFDCTKCPVAEYFKSKNLSKFCASTWCALDYPLAEMWNAELQRTGCIAGGATACDFRWKVKPAEENV